jgi:hypothetical protein
MFIFDGRERKTGEPGEKPSNAGKESTIINVTHSQ